MQSGVVLTSENLIHEKHEKRRKGGEYVDGNYSSELFKIIEANPKTVDEIKTELFPCPSWLNFIKFCLITISWL